MRDLKLDLRYAIRGLLRQRAFTVVAVLCLAVGIGVNAAVFSIVNGLLFRALPYPQEEELVVVRAANEGRGAFDAPVTYADLADLARSGAFRSVAGHWPRNVTLTGGDQPERLQGSSVTPGLFALLGVRPLLGREFTPRDGAMAGFEQVVILGEELWRRSFGADPDIVGKPIELNGRELVVAGVMPRDFRFPDADQLWLPLGSDDREDRARRFVTVVARLAPGVSRDAAAERLDALAARLATDHPASHTGWTLRVRSLRDTLVGPGARQLMLVMLGAVTLVLLIACANVANLLLGRAADREREMAIRTALGAGRPRVIRQLLAESLLLSLVSGALGVLIAVACVDAVLAVVPADVYTMREELAVWMRLEVDGAVLLYTLLVSVATGILFGTLPALHASRPDPRAMGRPGAGGERRREGVRNALVTAEIALSTALLIGSALLVQSFLRLQGEDAGFDPDPVLSLRIVLAGDQYDLPEARAAYFRAAIERIERLPGVASAVATSAIPADDGGGEVPVLAEGGERSEDDALIATAIVSTPGLFATLGIELLEGRDFTATELGDASARVAIVGASLAAALWPDGDATGRRFRPVDDPAEWFTVVGVAPDLQYEEFGEDDEQTHRQIHVPYAQDPSRQMALLVRAHGRPESLVTAVRGELRALDATLAPYDIMGLGRRRAVTAWTERMMGQTFAGFGAAALLLALAGVYGVMAYAVSRRRREIGVRLALGATAGAVVRMVVRRAARLTGVGIVAGVTGGWLLGRLLAGSLWGVGASDPATFVAVPALLGLVALTAAWVPARRAGRVDPQEVMRAE